MKVFKTVAKVLAPLFLIVSFSFCNGGGSGGKTSNDSPNVLEGYVYFPADDGSGNGIELWRSNGIDMPSLAADINSGPGDSFPTELMALDGKLYFKAYTPSTGYELFVYDPVLDAANLVADIYSGTNDSNPWSLIVFNGKLYLSSYTPASGQELFVYDPVLDEVNLVADINSGDSSYPGKLTAFRGKLYFSATTSATGYELFVYDPVLDKASLVADINPDSESSWPYPTDSEMPRLTIMGNILFFTADNGSDGYELYTLVPGEAPVQAADMNSGIDDFVWVD